MLTRRRMLILLVVVVALGPFVAAIPADAGLKCRIPEKQSGLCEVYVEAPGDPGDPVRPAPPKKPGNPGEPRKCLFMGKECPCHSAAIGDWNDGLEAYCKQIWPPNEAGLALHKCSTPLGLMVSEYLLPVESASPPDPAVLARRAVARMDLKAIVLGLAPRMLEQDGLSSVTSEVVFCQDNAKITIIKKDMTTMKVAIPLLTQKLTMQKAGPVEDRKLRHDQGDVLMPR